MYNGKGGKYSEKKNLVFFAEEKVNGQGKGGKYLEKENLFFFAEEKKN